MTSRSEAASGAVLEAMALERTVVAFDRTGSPELFGTTGVVIPHGDVAAAAAAVLDVVGRPTSDRVNWAARERYEAEFAPLPAARRLRAILDAAVDGAS
jgi:glycosyltransferase involved in cell wall biosynthesis